MAIPGPEDIFVHKLPNGITILARENPTSPSVVVNGYLRVGVYDEREEQAGLADFTASALTRGTAQRTFDQIYEQIESVGASLGFSAGCHRTGFAAKSLAEDLPMVLDVLADVLRQPTFPPQEVEKLRGEILTELEERAHDTRRMAALAFRELAYPPGHPYRRSRIGYPDTVAAITRDDLVRFYEGGYGPQEMLIVVVGGIGPGRAFELVERALGDWQGNAFAREPLPPVPSIDAVRQRYVPIPGKTQTDIVLGYPGPSRTEPDFLDALLCNTILGVFGMMGRLGEVVREQQGLAYYVYSQIEGGFDRGAWRAIAGVNPANVEQALDSIRREIRRICQEAVPAEELNESRDFLIGSLPLRLETNEGVAQAVLDMVLYDLGLDYLQRYEGLLRAITPERVQAAAQKWLNADAYALGMAGPPLGEDDGRRR